MAEYIFTNENLAQVLETADKPVLVDFWATWCGPCRMLAPHVEKLAETHATDLIVGKVNVDEEKELAEQFSIRSIPTLILFRNGKPVAQKVGYNTLEQLEAFIAQ